MQLVLNRSSVVRNLGLLNMPVEASTRRSEVVNFGPQVTYLMPTVSIHDATKRQVNLECKASTMKEVKEYMSRNWSEGCEANLIWTLEGSMELIVSVQTIPVYINPYQWHIRAKVVLKYNQGGMIEVLNIENPVNVHFDSTLRVPQPFIELLVNEVKNL